MTRNEMLRFISERPVLATQINSDEGQNFTRVKTSILQAYIDEYNSPIATKVETPNADAYKSAVMAFLVTLDQKGVLDELISEIK